MYGGSHRPLNYENGFLTPSSLTNRSNDPFMWFCKVVLPHSLLRWTEMSTWTSWVSLLSGWGFSSSPLPTVAGHGSWSPQPVCPFTRQRPQSEEHVIESSASAHGTVLAASAHLHAPSWATPAAGLLRCFILHTFLAACEAVGSRRRHNSQRARKLLPRDVVGPPRKLHSEVLHGCLFCFLPWG
jgi:hypothetical protein